MKRRPVQLVCLALLLSALSYTGSPALAHAEYQMQCGYLRVLEDYSRLWNAPRRQRQQPQPATRSFHLALAPKDSPTRILTLQAASVAAVRTTWTMRPPSANYAALQSFTGFGRFTA